MNVVNNKIKSSFSVDYSCITAKLFSESNKILQIKEYIFFLFTHQELRKQSLQYKEIE